MADKFLRCIIPLTQIFPLAKQGIVYNNPKSYI